MDLIAPEKLNGGAGRRTAGNDALAVRLDAHQVEGGNDRGIARGNLRRAWSGWPRRGSLLFRRIRRWAGRLGGLNRGRGLRCCRLTGPGPVKHAKETRHDGCCGSPEKRNRSFDLFWVRHDAFSQPGTFRHLNRLSFKRLRP
jgi:hypothetical protein